MTNRNPNEVLITRMLLEQLLSEGGPRLFSVSQGPAPAASIIGVEWRLNDGLPLVVLAYDRDVPEPLLKLEPGLEQKLAEKDSYIEQLERGLAEADRNNCGCLGYVGPRGEDGSPV